MKESSPPEQIARHLEYLLRRYRSEIEQTSRELLPPSPPLPIQDDCSGATRTVVTRDSSPEIVR